MAPVGRGQWERHRPGRSLWVSETNFIVDTVSGLLAFILLMRHFHRLYCSPSKDST